MDVGGGVEEEARGFGPFNFEEGRERKRSNRDGVPIEKCVRVDPFRVCTFIHVDEGDRFGSAIDLDGKEMSLSRIEFLTLSNKGSGKVKCCAPHSQGKFFKKCIYRWLLIRYNITVKGLA